MNEILQANSNPYAFQTLIVSSLGVLVTIILFIIGLNRYKKEQRWKRHEFVAKQISDMNNNKTVKSVMFMLDYHSGRYIELFPDKPEYKERYRKVTTEIIMSALRVHKEDDLFSDVEVAIRDYFDHYFSYFEMFHAFVKDRLITEQELEPYVQYWRQQLQAMKHTGLLDTITNYMVGYRYIGSHSILVGRIIADKSFWKL